MNKQDRKRENLQQNPRKNMKNKEGKKNRVFFLLFLSVYGQEEIK